MRILILGAGRAGRFVAENLVDESNDITVVDCNAERIEELQRRLDLRGIVGNASSPAILREAGIEDADMIIAVTASDETNLVVCSIATKLFNVPTRIARVRNHELSHYPQLLGKDGFGVSSTIWPEEAVTDALQELIEFPEAQQIINFSDPNASLVSLKATVRAPMTGMPARYLNEHKPDSSIALVSLYRGNRAIDVTPSTIIETGDLVVALTARKDIDFLINEIHGDEKNSRTIIITGNYALSVRLANKLNGVSSSFNIKILEPNAAEDLEKVSELPANTLLIEGHPTDADTLSSIGIDNCDAFVSLSRDDKTNIMSTLLAKRMGARRVISLVDNQTFGDLIADTPIDVVVSSTQAMLGELLKHLRHGDVVSAQTLNRGSAEVLEVIAHGNLTNSKVVGRAISAIRLPSGVRIAGVLRYNNNTVNIYPAENNLVIEDDDHVITFVSNKRLIPQVEKLFAVDVGFF